MNDLLVSGGPVNCDSIKSKMMGRGTRVTYVSRTNQREIDDVTWPRRIGDKR